MKTEMNNRTHTRRQLLMALAVMALIFLFAARAEAATFHVTTTADNGDDSNPTPGSLRKAIKDANAHAGLDTIAFNIPGAGVQTIGLTAQLPTLTDPVIIDGYTQPGSNANTLAGGDNAVLLIQLDGASAVQDGLLIAGGSSAVKGLVFSHFTQAGIYLTGQGGNLISGNFIGVDATGKAKASNVNGITIDGSSDNLVGGITPSARNLISGNTTRGIAIFNSGATDNVVQGNFIGTDVSGAAALGNNVSGLLITQVGTSPSDIVIGGAAAGAGNLISGNAGRGIDFLGNVVGVLIQGNLIGTDVTGKKAVGNDGGILINTATPNAATIGGTATGTRNIISGNKTFGVNVIANSTNIFIQGNYVGTDITGNAALGNLIGISTSSPNTTIGGSAVGARNVISANGSGGLALSSTGAQVLGNYIGLGADGSTHLGNNGPGVFISGATASNNVIGGPSSSSVNLIAFNNGAGIDVQSGTGNTFTQNSIFSNTGLGIDLEPVGVTQNDNNDLDTGPNNLQNYPALTSATSSNNSTTINGQFDSAGNTQYRIEFFANGQPDSTGFGEGQIYFGSTNITTNAGGGAVINVTIPVVTTGQYITATATDPAGNTSEFSVAVKINAPVPALSINDVQLTEGDSGKKNAVFTVTLSAVVALPVTVNYATADGTATAGSDYDAVSGTLTFTPGQTTQTIAVPVNGDTQFEPDETFFVNLSNQVNATVAKAQGTGKILNDDAAPPTATVQLEQSSYTVSESEHFKFINVIRTGDLSEDASVDYATSDATASQRTDYTLLLGTLRFAPGESTKTLTLLVTDDSYVEGDETLTLTLSNPKGMALGAQSVAQVTITDNDTNPNAPNAIDDVQNFIRQHYHDFLNREPDPPGFQGWQDILNKCAPGDTSCDRVEVSSDFFRSPEFHDRGYFVYRFYSATLGRIPKYQEFMPDLQPLSGFLTAQQLEDAKGIFMEFFEARPEFTQKYGQITDPAAFIDALSATAGVTLANRDQLVQQLQTNQITRAQAIRAVVESQEVDQKFYNEAFVVMQYFGYLRRDPDILYLDWLAMLNQTHDYRVLVNGFVNSTEYRQRFGQ